MTDVDGDSLKVHCDDEFRMCDCCQRVVVAVVRKIESFGGAINLC